MEANISGIQTPVNIFVKTILICYCHPHFATLWTHLLAICLTRVILSRITFEDYS